MVAPEIVVEVQPTWPIFEKCPHLREKGGVLTKIWNSRNSLSRTVLPNGSTVLNLVSGYRALDLNLVLVLPTSIVAGSTSTMVIAPKFIGTRELNI